MTNWLERAKREIAYCARQITVKADEGKEMAVMAVPEQSERIHLCNSNGSNGSADTQHLTETRGVSPMTTDQYQAICAWLNHIGETDATIIAQVLKDCRVDTDARHYFNMLIRESAPGQ